MQKKPGLLLLEWAGKADRDASAAAI